MSRVALIEVGSNAIRLKIKDRNTSNDEVIEELIRPVRLGIEAYSKDYDYSYSRETINSVLGTFMEFHSVMNSHQVDEYMAIGTSSIRAAKNAQELIEMVSSITGVSIRPITGKEQAEYLFQGFCEHATPINNMKTVLVNLSGGSLEVLSVENNQIQQLGSYDIGTVKLFQWLQAGGVGMAMYHLNQVFKDFVEDFFQVIQTPYHLYGTGGSMKRLIDLKELNFDKNSIDLDQVVSLMSKRSLIEWHRYLKGHEFRPNQIDVFMPCLMILNQFFSSFPPMSFEIGSWGILEGVFESIKDKKLDGFIFKKVS